MNFNVSPIAFYPSRAAQPWRAWYYQKKICVVTGDSLLPFLINDTPATAPDTVEIYEPNTDTLVSTRTGVSDILAHVSTVDGQSVTSWIYQGTSAGIFGFTTAGYYYLKIGNYYSDIIKFGAVEGDFVQLEWQTFDDIITVDGTLLSKYIKHKLIFETDLWHPTYEVKEEGKENNGIYYQTSRTLTKTSGFSAIVNEAVLDSLYSIGNGDKVTIEARRNGVLFSYETNRVEVKNTVQSDDVESVQVEFDLFSIIRKYQKSENAPEPLPIPTPPVPPTPTNYYIKGTVQSGTNSIQLKVNGATTTVQCVNGAFEYGYDSPLTSFETATYNNGYVGLTNIDKIKTLDLTESCLFKQATTVRFAEMTGCTSINFGNCTFENVTTADGFCADNSSLTTISIPEATFVSLTDTATQMFAGCSKATSISLPKSVQAYGANALFSGCTKLETINMPLATFASTTAAGTMFQQCTSLASVTMTAATFASATNFAYMFQGAQGWYDSEMVEYAIDFGSVFPACTAKPTTIAGIFQNAKFNSIDLTDLDLSACTDMLAAFENSSLRGLTMTTGQFSATTNFKNTFKNCKYLNSTTTTLINGISFAAATTCESMFAGSGGGPADNITFDAGTFANVTTCKSMFEGSGWKNIKFKRNVADFSNCADIARMYYNCTKVTEIDMAIDAHFGQITDATKIANIFSNCNALVDLYTPQNSELKCSLSLTQSESLTYDSIVSVCQWMATMTVETSKVLYLNSTAYNALTTAQKNNINSTYLQPKHWTIIG